MPIEDKKKTIKKAYYAFLQNMLIRNEDEALHALDEFVKNYGIESLQTISFDIDINNTVVTVHSLAAAICFDLEKVAERLLELNFSVDLKSRCKTNLEYHHLTPIMFAAMNDQHKIVELILQHDCNLLSTSANSKSVLMLSTSDIICKMIIDAAKKKNCLQELLDIKDHEDFTAYNYHRDRIISLFYPKDKKYFIQAMLSGQEELALRALDRLIQRYNTAVLPLLNTISFYRSVAGTTQIHGVLNYATFTNYMHVVSKLLDIGVDINQTTKCKDNTLYDGDTPLMMACASDEPALVKLLLNNNAELITLDAESMNIFRYVRSITVCDLILKEAEKRGCLTKLFKHKKNDINPYTFMPKNADEIAVIKRLMQLDEFNMEIDFETLLHDVRSSYWKAKKDHEHFDELCLILREKRSKKPMMVFDNDAATMTVDHAYKLLFGSKLPTTYPLSKTTTLQCVLAQFYALLNNPKECIKYLQFIDLEFSRYFKAKHGYEFPKLNSNSYDFKEIGGIYFPVPNDQYQGIKKYSALQEFLLSLFRQYGLGNNVYKLIGYITDHIINDMIKNGDLFFENRIGAGSFHHKVSHMLHIALLIYFLEDNKIDIPIKDILEALVTLKLHNEDSIIWNRMLDTRYYLNISFSEPHRLASVIMHDGDQLGVSALSDYLIDTACKGLIHFQDAYKALPYFSNMEMNVFFDKLQDHDIRTFMTGYLNKYSIERDVKKGRLSDKENDPNIKGQFTRYSIFATVPKQYNPCQEFTPNRCNLKQ